MHCRLSWRVALTTCLILFAACLEAADWPLFRGPDGNGHAQARGLPSAWDATTNVTWKTPLPGQGWSSPVVVSGKIYLTAAVPRENGSEGDFSLRTFCLNAVDGKLIWDTEVFQQDAATAPKIHGKNSHASPTPVVDGERIFVHFGHQGTACLDLQGRILWSETSLKYPPVHGNGGTPILVGNALIFSCDGGQEPFLVALDRDQGKILWKVPRESDATKKFSFSTPTLITVQGQPQVISPGSNVVSALDPRDGREIWRVRYDGYSVIPKPVFGHGLIYVCTGYNTPSLLAIRVDGHGDVTDSHVVWSVKKAVPHTPSLLLVGDELYMVSDGGVASCLDAHTGKVHWQERLGGGFSASPIYADGKIFFQNEEGDGTVIRPGTTFELLEKKNSLQERTLASYAVVDQTLFIRTDQHLFRIEAK